MEQQQENNSPHEKRRIVYLVFKIICCVIVGTGVFLTDYWLELGVAGGTPYVALVLMGLWFKDKNISLYLGIISLILIAVGYNLSPEGGEHWKVVLNRSFSSFAVLAVTIGVYIQKKTYIQLDKTNSELEAEKPKLLRIVKENEQLLFALHNSALVSITDNKGNITFANDTFCEISKYAEEELIGKNHRVLKSGKQPDGLFTGMWKALSQGLIWRGELCNKTKDGSFYWVYATIIPILNVEGGIDKYVAIRYDITPLKLAEANLKLKGKELERSNNELQKFAYVASHDLQEPLRMVSSYTQLLERKYAHQLDDDARDYIEFAVDGANRMQKLIKDLLIYSRVSTKSQPFTEIDCNKLLLDVQSNLSESIAESGAIIKVDELPTLVGDESQLTRIFQNLIGNAIKFVADKKPEISVSYKDINGSWQFSVKDNGIGIDEKYAERIFVIFQRLHTKEEYEGSGMGLAICKRIAERHDGDIWFESTPNNGTEFIFTISKNLT
jgi:two-component system, chemotaxis family, sensor kinase Cph1